MTVIGYERLRREYHLPVFEVTTPARVGTVTSVQRVADGSLLVPRSVAPAANEGALAHVLFALKYEGVNLQALSSALPLVDGRTMLAAFAQTPNGQFVRKACLLWELFTGRSLGPTPGAAATASYTALFDPALYVTGPSRRFTRWRVDFNGLGTPRYCPTVRRTATLQTLLDKDLLGQATAFAHRIGHAMLERALSWAYLSETEGSFAIEGETPSPDKARAFAALLKQAHVKRPLTEPWLVELQNSAITNPLDQATAFRDEQNWLRGPGRGAAGITYVPPPPGLARDLMNEFIAMLDLAGSESAVDPLVMAGVASFGFVFIHPFMDGNGRLSRFLLHQVLCQSGQLPDGFLLPVSVAMKRHEDEYLSALNAFSRPARQLCGVKWLHDEDYEFDWPRGYEGAFRYFDATACVEFSLQMTEAALEQDLRQEAMFLADYDAVMKRIDGAFDVRGPDLAALVLRCFERDGVLSGKRRAQYAARVPAAVFDAIERAVQARLAAREHSTVAQTSAPAPSKSRVTKSRRGVRKTKR